MVAIVTSSSCLWQGCYGYNSLKITLVATIAPPLVDRKNYNSFPFSPIWLDPLWIYLKVKFGRCVLGLANKQVTRRDNLTRSTCRYNGHLGNCKQCVHNTVVHHLSGFTFFALLVSWHVLVILMKYSWAISKSFRHSHFVHGNKDQSNSHSSFHTRLWESNGFDFFSVFTCWFIRKKWDT